MATKDDVLKNNPPKGSKEWSEQDYAQQAQKGTLQYVDDTATPDSAKETEPQEQQKDDGDKKKTEEKSNEISNPKDVINELNEFSYSIPLNPKKSSEKTNAQGSSNIVEPQSGTQQQETSEAYNWLEDKGFDKGHKASVSPERVIAKGGAVQASSKDDVSEQQETSEENLVTVPQEDDAELDSPSENKKKRMSYVELYERFNPKPDPKKLKKDARRARTRNIIAALGDGISAFSNLHYTTQGAPDMYDGKTSLSEKSQARYDKIIKDYKDNLEKYRNGWMRAYQMDQEAEAAEDMLEQRKAEDEYKRERDEIADDQWNAEHELKKDGQEEAKRKNKADEDLEKKKLAQRAAAGKTYNRNVNIGNGKEKEAEPIEFTDKGKKITVPTNKWEVNYPRLYGILVKEKIIPEQRNFVPTESQMEAAVKRHWNESQTVTGELISMSEGYDGYDKALNDDVTIPYNVWIENAEEILNKMVYEDKTVFNDITSGVIKVSRVKEALSNPETLENLIRKNLSRSPKAKKFVYGLIGKEAAEDGTEEDFSQYEVK